MAQKKEIKPVKPDVLDVYYPDEVGIVYANHANLAVSNSDLAIDFGIREPNPKNKKRQSVTINARVIMSPQHGKMFASKLMDMIQAYEKTFGEIQTQPLKK